MTLHPTFPSSRPDCGHSPSLAASPILKTKFLRPRARRAARFSKRVQKPLKSMAIIGHHSTDRATENRNTQTGQIRTKMGVAWNRTIQAQPLATVAVMPLSGLLPWSAHSPVRKARLPAQRLNPPPKSPPKAKSHTMKTGQIRTRTGHAGRGSSSANGANGSSGLSGSGGLGLQPFFH